MSYLFLIALALGCALFCYRVAGRRKANQVFWAAMGAMFGPFAIPFVYLAGRFRESREE